MPPREWKPRIEDILESIQKIQKYTRGMSFREFEENGMVIDAVIRNFGIIGEAAKHIPDDIQSHCPGIPWRAIADMRNVMIHEYFGISLRIIWDTIQNDLEPLVQPLRSLLDRS